MESLKIRVSSLALAIATVFTMSTTSLSACTKDEITIQDSMAEGYDGIAELQRSGMYGFEITLENRKKTTLNSNEQYVYIDFDNVIHNGEIEEYLIETSYGTKGYISYDKIKKAWRYEDLSVLFPNNSIDEVITNGGLNIRNSKNEIIGVLKITDKTYALKDNNGRTTIIIDGPNGTIKNLGTVAKNLSVQSESTPLIDNPQDSSLVKGVEGIDISEFNNYSKEELISLIKENNIQYVYIRIGFSGYSKDAPFNCVEDSKAKEYIEVCESLGIPFGLYYVPKSITREEALQEAQFITSFINCLEIQKNNTFPLALDYETEDANDRLLGNTNETTQAIETLIDTLVENRIIINRNNYTIYTNLKGLGTSKKFFIRPLFSTKKLTYDGYAPNLGYWIATYTPTERNLASKIVPIFLFQYSTSNNTLDRNNIDETIYAYLNINKTLHQ